MWITRVSIQNPVFATMVMVGITVLGLFSYARLRVEQMPDVNLPFVLVLTSYPGAAPEAVEADVTKPIEYAVNQVSGVKLIRSNSMENQSQVFVEFRLSTDMSQAMQDVRDKIGTVRPGFPARREGSAGRARGQRKQPARRVARGAFPDDRPARAHLADRSDDRQGPGKRAGRRAHRRQRARHAADPGPDQAGGGDGARHRRRPGDQGHPRGEPGRARRAASRAAIPTPSCASRARSRTRCSSAASSSRSRAARRSICRRSPTSSTARRSRSRSRASTAGRRSRSISRKRRMRTSSRPAKACAPRSRR